MGDRLVIPLHYQPQILWALHSTHQGVTNMQARANQTVDWPRMNASIRNFKAGYTTCSNIAPSQSKETITLSPPPQWPFQQICIDYFEISGHTYLSCVDRFSGWLSLSHPWSHHATPPSLPMVPQRNSAQMEVHNLHLRPSNNFWWTVEYTIDCHLLDTPNQMTEQN